LGSHEKPVKEIELAASVGTFLREDEDRERTGQERRGDELFVSHENHSARYLRSKVMAGNEVCSLEVGRREEDSRSSC